MSVAEVQPTGPLERGPIADVVPAVPPLAEVTQIEPMPERRKPTEEEVLELKHMIAKAFQGVVLPKKNRRIPHERYQYRTSRRPAWLPIVTGKEVDKFFKDEREEQQRTRRQREAEFGDTILQLT